MNKKDVLKEIKKGTFFLKDADDKLKADEEVVLESVKLNGLYLKFADDKLKGNKNIVLAAVKQNGMSIYFASNKLKADKEIAQEAVKNNSEALEYVDSKLKDSLKILCSESFTSVSAPIQHAAIEAYKDEHSIYLSNVKKILSPFCYRHNLGLSIYS